MSIVASLGNILGFWKFMLVLPHLVAYKNLSKEIRQQIREDIWEMNRRCRQRKGIAFYLVYHKSYRNLFYYRVGGKWTFVLRFFLPSYKDFYIKCIGDFGGGAFVLNHPYSTIVNAKRIGRNFTICQLTTIGNKEHGRNDLVPTIGDDVSLGANVNIIGNIKIGNHVIVGAGSVVVRDVPDNCVVAGNPARIIRYL